MTDEQMRSILLEYFKSKKSGFEFGQEMEEGVRAIAVRRGLHPADPTGPPSSTPRWQEPVKVHYQPRYNQLEGDGWTVTLQPFELAFRFSAGCRESRA